MLKQNGFTLLEILISLIILTLSFVMVVGLFGTGLISGQDAENTAIAMNLAQRRMEEIRNLAFASITDESRATVSGFSAFEREVAVTQPETGLKQVTVTVYWTSKSSDVGTSLVSYISNN